MRSMTPNPRRIRPAAVAAAAVAAIALAGCAGPGEPAPEITGTPSTYSGVEELRDAFVAAGGECPDWAPIETGDYDADAGRCDDRTVIAVYRDPAQLAEAIERATALMTETHLLAGPDWLINTPDPHHYVEALGGTVISG